MLTNCPCESFQESERPQRGRQLRAAWIPLCIDSRAEPESGCKIAGSIPRCALRAAGRGALRPAHRPPNGNGRCGAGEEPPPFGRASGWGLASPCKPHAGRSSLCHGCLCTGPTGELLAFQNACLATMVVAAEASSTSRYRRLHLHMDAATYSGTRVAPPTMAAVLTTPPTYIASPPAMVVDGRCMALRFPLTCA